MSNRRQYILEATTSAVSWTIDAKDSFDIKRVVLKFDSGPSSAGNIVVTLDADEGSAYDAVLRTIDPVGYTSISIENLDGVINEDTILISYANPDSRSITGLATIEI